MIKALFKTRGGSFSGFDISGHSGYAESGSDIICAAFSTMVNLVTRILDESGIEYDSFVDDKVPALSVNVLNGTAVSSSVIKSFYCEALEIAKENPKYAAVKKAAE